MSQNATSSKSLHTDVEPKAGAAAMPVWLLIALLLIFFFGGMAGVRAA